MAPKALFAVLMALAVATAQAQQPLPEFREALEALYTNTHGMGWTNNDGWLKSDDYCTWYGVGCPIHNHTMCVPAARARLSRLSICFCGRILGRGRLSDAVRVCECGFLGW